jgi:DNA invertase Pin-like site-specific DNA recombinase
MNNSPSSPKIRSWHLQRQALVYVRQSTPQQVLEHTESTDRQYALAERAVALGWPPDAVVVIDEDLGRSGASVEGRTGFQRLLAEVALDHVGLILGLEMSRLARCCKDWHQLLELCARFRTLLADTDGLYDTTDYNDRLLLGLKGTLSEAELHVIKERMYQGKLNKAKRGELFGHAPIGYVRGPGGKHVLDPDEQVRAVLRLIFDAFDRQATLHGLLRYLKHEKILLPVRARSGPEQGELRWCRPNRATLSNLLHHPIYAGAYRYGHRPTDPRRQQPGRRTTGRVVCRPEECVVLLWDRLPAYITRERFEANVRTLEENRARHASLGAPRRGASLLSGLIRCGRCGQRMTVNCSGTSGTHSYHCGRAATDYGEPVCQSVSGPSVDEAVAEQLLRAVEPEALEASMEAVADLERERVTLECQWRQRLERAGQEANRAMRQYQQCEPENRLVARTLEVRWEETLREQQRLEEDFARWQREAPTPWSESEHEALRALAEDVPRLWHAETTTPQERQQVARLLLEEVRVKIDRTSERVEAELHWIGGCVQSLEMRRRVNRYDQMEEYPRLVERLRAMSEEKRSHAEMAARLNAEGFRPPKRVDRFNGSMVRNLLWRLGMESRPALGSEAGLGVDEYRPGSLARKLEIGRETVRSWMRHDWVHLRQDDQGHAVLWADAEELVRLKQLHQTPRTWANKALLEKLRRPKERNV